MKNKKNTPLKIIISGNVGVGKSTLCKKIVENYNLKTFLKENEECPELFKFVDYLSKNPDKYNPHAFPMHKYFLEKRFEKLKNFSKNEKIFIQDRFLIEQYEIFIKTGLDKNYLKKEEFTLLKNLYKKILSKIDLPEIIFILKSDTKFLMERIKKRGLDYEQGNIDSFVSNLKYRYEKFHDVIKKKFPSIHIFIIDSNHLNANEVRDKACEIIDKFLK